MVDSRTRALLVLNALPTMGPVTLARLFAAHGPDPEHLLALGEAELRRVQGVGPAITSAIRDWRRHVDVAREEDLLAAAGARFVTWFDDDYPVSLRQIGSPPIGLYVKGDLRWPRPVVAIIGTREPTRQGLAIAREWSAELARRGATVVSGLARGIDTAAHQATVDHGGVGGAVLGGGLDVPYPPENALLAERLAARGAVMTEFPFGRVPDRRTFPMRNRIVSGLSDLVLVVETDLGGGSLHTARFAGEQGRTVCAVPGPLDRRESRGCHALIREGATLVTNVDELLGETGNGLQALLPLDDPSPSPPPESRRPAPPTPPDLAPTELKVLSALRGGPRLSPGALADALEIPAGDLASTLLVLELRGLVHRAIDGRYEAGNG